jgi:hypothetical protein
MRNIIIQKSSIKKRFTDIKSKYYKKPIISDYADIGYVLKYHLKIERLYVDDVNVAETAGKAIYIEFKDGDVVRVSLSSIIK